MGSLRQLSIIKGEQRELQPKLLHRIFEENIENGNCGERSAIMYHDGMGREQSITYNQLNAKTNQLSRVVLHLIKDRYQSQSNQDGDWIIAVCMSPSNELVQTLLTIWKSGAAYLPIDPSFPQNRIDHILTEAKPVLVIHDNDIDPETFKRIPSITIGDLEKLSNSCKIDNIDADETLTNDQSDLGIILYTSGSTGVPKGVRLPHSIVLNRLTWQWKTFPYSNTEKIGIFKTALTFVDSVAEIWGPLLSEMTILVVPKEVTKDPERLVQMLEHYRIERLVLVPTLLRSLLMYLPLQNQLNLLYNLKIWVCSGEPLSVALAKEFYDYFKEGEHILCNFYGSTEIMGDVTYFVCESKGQLDVFEKVPIGYPLYNTIIYLLDNDYRPVKYGETGELFVAGSNLAAGYVNGRDPDRFIENPLNIDLKYNRLYRTGDFACILKGGILQYEGRTDSQIKIRGHRVDLSEIEKQLLTIDEVDKAVVLCYHAGEIDQALLGFVTVCDGSRLQTGLQLETILKECLAPYMVPQVILMDAIPLLVNGKVDRQTLLKFYGSTNNNDDTEISIDYDFNGVPENLMSIAKDLFHTIGQVIGRSTRATLCLNSNFYELGGNSLNSIYTVTLLREKGYFIGITDFITAQNLEEILYKISRSIEYQVGSDIDDDNEHSYRSEILKKYHKNQVIEVITTSFFEKADLEQWLKPNIFFTDYGDILEEIWDVLVEKCLSFVVYDRNDRLIAVALNFDARDEPEVPVNSKLVIVFEFLEYLEGPIRDTQLPSGMNQILHAFMMGTSSELNAQENIAVMHFMENEVLKLAKKRNFAGILTTNTNPLTQQLGNDVYGYKTLLDYQVNQYVYHDDTKPFGKAPDTQRAIVHWKSVA